MSQKPPAAGSDTTAVPMFALVIPILHLTTFLDATDIPISKHAPIISPHARDTKGDHVPIVRLSAPKL